jgi:hypothetical protein
LPQNVYLTTTFRARTGDLYNITTGRDDNKDGFFTDRPPGVQTMSGSGPNYFVVDFNVSKAFQLQPTAGTRGTGPQISIFANVDNAFNRTNLRAPSGVMTSRNFGRSTSAYPPREIEAGMRFQF